MIVNADQIQLAPATARQLAALQVEVLPDSMISKLGTSFVRAFYQFSAHSQLEAVGWAEREGRVVGGCVLSLSPWSLNARLLAGTSMLFWLLARFFQVGPMRLARTALARPLPAHEKLPELMLLYVDPDGRSRRIGASLVRDCETFLARRGAFEYIVKTFDQENHPALRFYLREGFEVVGRATIHGTPFRVLRKRIATPVA